MSELEQFIKDSSKILSTTGQKTGLVVNLGDNVSFIVPVYKGFVMKHAITKFDIKGQDITKYFQRLLLQEGGLSKVTWDKYVIAEIKKKLCYVALDLNKEKIQSQGKKEPFTRPDGTIIYVEESRFLAPECLFNPSLLGKDIDPLDDTIVKTIGLCDIQSRRELFGNIILSGSALLKGLNERLQLEIKELIPEFVEARIQNVKQN
ncbi:hypothetical protein LCGC14_1250520 [marine sediment metagenome]|uniref:Actin-like protein N-terminal domain-containing protein n=2 Tax=unclassified sequences TaxID=12908 RepID=A0A0F9P758_9ZZZZ|nr:putative actin-related protein [uncultured organism]